ncbi:MAG: phytoene desaturase family protein [Flavihumibacter sp.]|nr:phytoene desaturase family protein [Flavihumibacter sp.]
MKKSAIIIGSGFAGLSAASFLAKAGWQVTVLEKNATPGGRARQLKDAGFTFDMGPSWYWMPDVFDRYFQQFGKTTAHYYKLTRLSPSYRIYWSDGPMDIPSNLDELKLLFEKIEPGAAKQLDNFLTEAAYKYKVGIQKLVFKPGQSLTEFLDWQVIKGVFKLDVFTSMKTHVHKYFKSPKIRQILEFPVLFLGALPEDTPALYSLMNYADIVGGTWYPEKGMYSIVDAMYKLALELGVQFQFNENVSAITIEKNTARTVTTTTNQWQADVVIGGADYHFIESKLLPASHQSYSSAYWDKRVLAPSCLLFYVGLNKKLKNMLHHSLFFDVPFEPHAKEIYTTRQWPEEPLFYVSTPSVTDDTVAPPACENLFLLIPVAAGLTGDTEERRDFYFDKILSRMEKITGQEIKSAIIYKKSFAHSDFVNAYNSFKGNAYGLANTLMQTAVLKPTCRSKKVNNLFYTGQLTVPGPGVPPSLISGEVVAAEVVKHFG